MRITDIILEKSDAYQQGYDAVDKLLSPTRWNEPASGTVSSKPNAAVDPLDARDAVSAVVNGRRFYEKERSTLITLANELKAGKRKTGQDAQQLSAILKLASSGKPINGQQRSIVADFAKEL